MCVFSVIISLGKKLSLSLLVCDLMQLKQVGTRVRVVFFNVQSSAEASRVVEVLQRGKRTASDPLHGVDDPLYSLPLCLSTAAIPYCDTLHPLQSDRRCPAASPSNCCSSALSEIEGAALDNCCGVGGPCEVC